MLRKDFLDHLDKKWHRIFSLKHKSIWHKTKKDFHCNQGYYFFTKKHY